MKSVYIKMPDFYRGPADKRAAFYQTFENDMIDMLMNSAVAHEDYEVAEQLKRYKMNKHIDEQLKKVYGASDEDRKRRYNLFNAIINGIAYGIIIYYVLKSLF